MSVQISIRKSIVLVIILSIGLGLAFTLTSMAHAGMRAAPVESFNAPSAPPKTYHVAKTGDGDGGLEWSKAFTDVQDALSIAVSGDEIWVAKGIYKPGSEESDSFNLVPGAALYGGFAGTETSRSQRNWITNPTILSGDIDGNDIAVAGVVMTTSLIFGSNSNHVVYADGTSAPITESTVLDGFTITAGQADGSDSDNDGGGFYCNGSGSGGTCKPSLKNLTYSANKASRNGGAMYHNASDDGTSYSKVEDTTFTSNSADGSGGAIFNDAFDNGVSSPIFNKTTFVNNSAKGSGGAIYNDAHGGPPVKSGGVSSPLLIDTIFSGNSAENNGGAVYNDGSDTGSSKPQLLNTIFSGNSAGVSGGAIYNDGHGDILYPGSSSSPSITNVTFYGNSADDDGGAIYNDGDKGASKPEVRNSILWNNIDSSGTGTISATIFNSGSVVTLTHSLIQSSGGSDSWVLDSSYINITGNIDTDPKFIAPSYPNNVLANDNNLRLQADSLAIDAGDNSFAGDILADLDGVTRIMDGDGDGIPTIDMGPYEVEGYYQLSVAKTGAGGGQVTSSPQGINCGVECSKSYLSGTEVTLTAAADTDSIFTGWSGHCSGSGTEDCELTLDEDKNVTANFNEYISEPEIMISLPLVSR